MLARSAMQTGTASTVRTVLCVCECVCVRERERERERERCDYSECADDDNAVKM